MLALVQFGSFIACVLMAMMLIFSRLHIHHISQGYETVRWTLVSAMVLCATQFLLQMIFGLRAQGDDVGALFNILFFSPAAFMVSYSSIRMSCPNQYLKRYTIAAGASTLLILACFVIGWFVYGSLHMKHSLYTMGFIFFLGMMFQIIDPIKETRRTRRRIEDETGGNLANYNTYMRIGVVLLYGVSVFLPFVVFNTRIIIAFGPFYFMTLFYYIVSFVALGYNIQPVSHIIDTPEVKEVAVPHSAEDASEQVPILSASRIEQIEQSVAAWRTGRGYSDPNLTCQTMALRLGMRRTELSQYISQCHGLTFRIWLSNIRIEEVKRLLLEHEDYSNETIAQECGFSSRTWLQQKFKASTGMTPSEWRVAQQKA